MTRQMLAIFLLALVWFEPTALPAATKLTIRRSTINPRISPLWIVQEKGYFFTGGGYRHHARLHRRTIAAD